MVTDRRGETEVWCQNVKFKALVLIPSRMDGVSDACLFVCTQLRFGNHKNLPGRGER